MTGVTLAWAIGVAFTAYNQGLSKGQFPPPYAFIDLTIVMIVCGLIAKANGRIGGLLAFGLLLPIVLIGLQQASKGTGPISALALGGGSVTPAPANPSPIPTTTS